jgi:putative hydrolase of the HAD superfamily
MNRKSNIRVVFFDGAGTLIHLPMGVGHHYRLVAERHGFCLDEAALNAAFRTVWKQIPLRRTTGIPGTDDDKGWWRELVALVLKDCGVNQGDIAFDAWFEDIYLYFAGPGVWHPYPETIPVLSALKGKYRLAVISNFDKRLRSIFHHLELTAYFEKIFISSEVGADKPASCIFQRALLDMRVRPEHALHAGDDPVLDWDAAAAAGMEVFRLNRPRNSLLSLLDLLS